MVETEIVNKAKDFVIVLERAGIHVDKAFLYGSYLDGTATDESDIDVMIVSRDYNTRNDFLAGEAWRLISKVDLRIEPYLVGLDRFMTDDVSPPSK